MHGLKQKTIFIALIGLIVLTASVSCSSGQAAAPTATSARATLPPAAPPATGPARQPAGSGSPAQAPLETKQVGEFKLSLYSSPNPPVRGSNKLEIILTDAAGKPVTDAKVAFDLDMTTMSHGKNVVSAQPAGEGRYSGQAFFMMAGPWRSIVVIERPDQPPVQARFDFRVNLR